MTGRDLPILFSAPMVRALLAGTKTQTRRALNPQPNMLNGGKPLNDGRGSYSIEGGWKKLRYARGDRLYVREHWRVSKPWDDTAPRDLEPRKMSVVLEAGGSIANEGDPLRWIPSDWPHGERPDWIGKFRQGMHMPRWASRITLTVTDVRVERLQDISEEDAVAEGIEKTGLLNEEVWKNYFPEGNIGLGFLYPSNSYRTLWQSINGPGSWDANPWVAAYTFTVALGNIDQIGRAA